MRSRPHPMLTHGLTKTTEHKIWDGIIQRCTNPNSGGYRRYGGRGIEVCDRWRESFEDFLADMGRRPTEGHSIDRIDNDGPYSPENCQWATRVQQDNNRQNTRYVTLDGERLPLAFAARRVGIKLETLRERLSPRSGMSEYDALHRPVR